MFLNYGFKSVTMDDISKQLAISKKTIYAHYQKLDASFYKTHDTGDLMNRISEDVSKVRMYLGPAVMYSLNLAALIVMVVGVMISIDVKLTLYALLPLPLMSIGIYFISSKINI
jgi:ATP-binding cassette subfamily B protein